MREVLSAKQSERLRLELLHRHVAKERNRASSLSLPLLLFELLHKGLYKSLYKSQSSTSHSRPFASRVLAAVYLWGPKPAHLTHGNSLRFASPARKSAKPSSKRFRSAPRSAQPGAFPRTLPSICQGIGRTRAFKLKRAASHPPY